MAGPFAPSGRRAAARRRTPGVLGPRARPRPRCGLGLGAALRAGRKRPGPRPSPPHTPPARLGAADGKARDASPAGWWGLPSAPSGRVPPAPSGLRAATPAHPGRLGRRPPRPPAAVGELWRLVAACGGSGLRPCGACQPPAVARGHPVGPQGQAPTSPAPVAASVLRAAPPPLVGAFGAVRPSGPGAPGCARPARRSGPAPLRRPAAEPRGGVRALWARPVRGRNLDAAR